MHPEHRTEVVPTSKTLRFPSSTILFLVREHTETHFQ